MKKLTALLLIAVLTLALAACSEPPAETQPPQTTAPTESEPPVTTEPAPTEPPSKFDPALCRSVIGSWTTTITLDGSLLNMKDLEGSTAFVLTYTLKDDGDYTMGVDQEEFTKAITDYEALLSASMVESLHSKFAAECKLQGMSKKQTQAAWEDGKQAEAEAQAQDFLKELDLTGRFSALIRTGDYYVEAGRLYLSTGEDVYESYGFAVTEGNLVLSDCDNVATYRSLNIPFPLTLTPITNEGAAS